ncbi:MULTISPECIES: hypothetical protein [unclassified Streptomyces]|uniref:hypothetical protein n=1 Tax=unclassified Streptomyces TaxID=2593676 RepID=UPI00093D69A0|nr:hypothetical protein [Streptomyces sp. TSRI0107]OKJ88019.1 hypothetical protein AMK31_12935 [Streptomyces sp. TSRI0107]
MSKPVSRPITVEWGKETVVVSDFPRTLPGASAVDDRAKLVRAGTANPLAGLTEDAWHAVARASTAPALVAHQLRPPASDGSGLLLEEHVDGATLRSVHSRVWLSELFPGIQPRTSQEKLDVDDPKVIGEADGDRPLALLRYRYEDRDHLWEHIKQTLSVTLHRNSYAESILARRVTRALIVHPVVFEFEDGGEPVTALVARDGITRLASAWKVLGGAGLTNEEIAAQAADALLTERRQPANEPRKPLTQRLALGREEYRRHLHEEFTTAIDAAGAGGAVTDRTVRIAQTYLVPAHIAVGIEGHELSALRVEDVFDDALRSILASVHVEFKPWDDAAQNVEVATRALKLVAQTRSAEWGMEKLLQDVHALATGRLPETAVPDVFDDPRIPRTALWRAVYLVHALTRPPLHEELKTRAKDIKNDRRMSTKGYAGLLGPVIDLPWRSEKGSALAQARNAWSNGGVLCADVLADGWNPVPTDDFTSLVEPALKGDVHARCTLAVAGGIALIADKLLTRNVGSAVAAVRQVGKVPFRADVSVVIGGLAGRDNAAGLWLLAHAAQRFRSGTMPGNTSARPRLGAGATPPYQHVAVDLDAPDRVARDGRSERALTTWDVVYASDTPRAEEKIQLTLRQSGAVGAVTVPSSPAPSAVLPAQQTGSAQPVSSPVRRPSTAQMIEDQRKLLAKQLTGAIESLTNLERLGAQRTFPPLLGDAEEWATLRDDAVKIVATVEQHDPRKSADAEEQEEDDEAEDEVEDADV